MTPTERCALDGDPGVGESAVQGITNASAQYHRIDNRVEVKFYAVGRSFCINLSPVQWQSVMDMIRRSIDSRGY